MDAVTPFSGAPFDPSFLRDKSVLVTGGTGTIGSEIVRQVLRCDPRVVRVFSRDESKQAHLRVQLPKDAPLRYLIGDVRDQSRLRVALEGIDVVFHAAALKHVSSCEYNPFEAVQTNVVGTQNLIEASRAVGVKRLVAISTDKAVNPVNTMGATKLLAENVLKDAWKWNPQLVISVVRFGNVMGSRGSLLPLMVQGMEESRRVEVTCREMTRFMMTIGDAVTLVLSAAERAVGGEVFILKMPALQIGELVDVFVSEYSRGRGWAPDEVEIREVGIRPGEKLHEELVTAEECARLEEHDQMYVVQPFRRRPVEIPVGPVPAAGRSDQTALLGREEIAALLDRAGLLPTPGRPVPRALVHSVH